MIRISPTICASDLRIDAWGNGWVKPHLLAQGRPVTPTDQAAGQAWWAHVKALADDSTQGRVTGSEGYLRAARYVVSQFDSMGLQPAGVKSYYQQVRFD